MGPGLGSHVLQTFIGNWIISTAALPAGMEPAIPGICYAIFMRFFFYESESIKFKHSREERSVIGLKEN